MGRMTTSVTPIPTQSNQRYSYTNILNSSVTTKQSPQRALQYSARHSLLVAFDINIGVVVIQDVAAAAAAMLVQHVIVTLELGTLGVMIVVGQQQDAVADGGHSDQQLQAQDRVNLPYEATADGLVPEVEAGGAQLVLRDGDPGLLLAGHHGCSGGVGRCHRRLFQ